MLGMSTEKSMTLEKKEATLLHEAFSQFNATSFELAESYRNLKSDVQALKNELKLRNEENKQLREEAERNHRLAAVGEMAARMAHELRNPLGSIELFASLLRKEFSGQKPDHKNDPEKLEWATHLSTAVMTMDDAITNLLLFTRKPNPQFQRVNLKQTIHELLLFVKHLLQQSQIEYHETCDELTQLVWCDEHLIRQVLLNLILNAIDAMPQGGSLRISASITKVGTKAGGRGEGEATITLTDNGLGIPQEILGRIFDPFFTTKGKGTGLGLAIAQNAISAHHGLLQVESREGSGTIFKLRLPLKPEKEQ